MAIVPPNTRFVGISSSVELKEKKSALINSETQPYTIEDIAQTVGGGGGGGIGSLKIEADGQIGNPTSYTMNVVVPVDVIVPGVNTFEAVALPSLSISAGGGYGGGGTFNATTLSFPDLPKAYGLNLQSTTTLQTFSMPDTVSFVSSVYLQNNSALTTINMPSVTDLGYFDITSCPNLTTLNFPSLVNVNTFSSNGDAGAFGTITAAKFPAVRSCGFSGGGINSVDLPAVTTVTNVSFYSGSINLINLPGAVSIPNGYVDMQYKQVLNTFILGTAGVTKRFGTIYQGQTGPYTQPQINMANGYFNQSTVDNWLIMLASLDGTNGTISANNGSFYIYGGGNAAPSQAGLDAKAILLARGWYISTN